MSRSAGFAITCGSSSGVVNLGTGSIITSTGTAGVLLIDGATLNMTDGSITSSNYGIYHGGDNEDDSPTVIINIKGGSVSGTYGIGGVQESIVTVTGGTITGTTYSVYLNYSKSTLDVQGGTIKNESESNDAIYVGNLSKVIISGGTVISGRNAITGSAGAEVEVTGGTITGTNAGIMINAAITATITGGTITGTNSCGLYVGSSYSSVTIGDGDSSVPLNTSGSPKLKGGKYGVHRVGSSYSFDFGNGYLEGGIAAYYGVPVVTREGYGVYKNDAGTIAYLTKMTSSNTTVSIGTTKETLSGGARWIPQGVFRNITATVSVNGTVKSGATIKWTSSNSYLQVAASGSTSTSTTYTTTTNSSGQSTVRLKDTGYGARTLTATVLDSSGNAIASKSVRIYVANYAFQSGTPCYYGKPATGDPTAFYEDYTITTSTSGWIMGYYGWIYNNKYIIIYSKEYSGWGNWQVSTIYHSSCKLSIHNNLYVNSDNSSVKKYGDSDWYTNE